MKKRKWLALLGLLLFFLAILGLFWAEKGNEQANIHSLRDAIWYALVTVTTVGYGDYAPITFWGRFFGILFVLMSFGFFALMISTVLSLMTGRLLPSFRLWFYRKHRWFVFSRADADAEFLAQDLLVSDPGAFVIFCHQQDAELSGQRRIIRIPASPESLLEGHEHAAGGERILLLWGEHLENLALTCRLASRVQQTVFKCQEAPGTLPQGVLPFDRNSAVARQYWLKHPLGSGDQTILLIGEGALASAFLSHTLKINVRQPFARTEIHVFGNWEAFRHAHYQLGNFLSLGSVQPDRDSLFFHESGWDSDASLLARANRILFCFDSSDENAKAAIRLYTWFPTDAEVWASGESGMPGIQNDDETREIMTREIVLREGLNRLAQAMHAIYQKESGNGIPAWQELSPFLRESNIAAADHLAVKARLLLGTSGEGKPTREEWKKALALYQAADADLHEKCLKNEHERWMRFHSLYNWQYGEKRDNQKRLHPCMLPWDALSEEEKSRDAYAWTLLALEAEEET